MSFTVPANQPVSFTVYFQAVCEESRIDHDFIKSRLNRIQRAFEMGEPIAMLVEELKMIKSLNTGRVVNKTPLQLAKRVVRVTS